VVPWLNLGVSVVAVPLVAMIGAGLLTRSRLPIERRAD
jgi:putative ABC transport system permease protein